MSLKGPLNIIDGPCCLPLVGYAPTLDAWTHVPFDKSDAPFSRYLNLMIIAVSSTALTVTLGGLAVYGLTRFHHKMS
jgi:ABC-type glycerol-3-phosphate transport system permease component